MIGEIALSAVSFIKNINFKGEKSEGEKIFSIFSKLNLEKNRPSSVKNDDRIDEIREYLLPIMIKKSSIATIFLLFILLSAVASLEISGIYLVVMAMFYIFLIYYPKIK